MNKEIVTIKLTEAIYSADRDYANRIIDDWACEHSYKSAILDLMNPLLKRLCNSENYDGLTVAQGYISSKVVEDTLNKIIIEHDPDRDSEIAKTPVIIGNIEDDCHALGRRMVGTFLKMNGWKVIDLGNDVLAEDFVDAALEHNARIIGVSAMMLTTAENIKKVREEIDRRGVKGKIQLAVGGAVFNLIPELCSEVGGDGSAESAMEVHELFLKLLHQSGQAG